ncbi:hypothetical protein BOX15_Mlig020520g1 [Macrostomum lignano]|uniref:Uncharacterized protein n=1 Tax=Macrostomum lignano TaxID=282301 RepID=A0A267GQE3_9PLAT|nr:hypothetical protein BOX15_Mlig020520g1 [Macrostomum lignano]
MSDKLTNLGAALYTSASGENTEPVRGVVRDGGSVPTWLSGSLIRNGPGLFEVGDTQYHHYFDGLALLRKFSISNGQVEFTSQFLRSDAYTTNMAYKRIVVSEFGTRTFPDPCKSWLGRFASYFWPSEEEAKLRSMVSDNTFVNIFPIGDQVYATTETNFLNRIDPRTLDCLEKVDLNKVIPINTVTAHPHIESDGSVLNVGTAFRDREGPQYVFARIPPGGLDKAEVVAKIPSRWRFNPAYFHSFAMTRNYLVLVESPLALNIPRLIAAGIFGLSYGDCLNWYDGYGSLLHVVSRADGKLVQTLTAEAFFTFHHMNAYEVECKDGSVEIVIDLSAYKSGDLIKRLSLKEMQQLSELPKTDVTLRRYRLKLGSTEIVKCTEPACRLAIEFPQINYRYNGEPYRYGYGVGKSMSTTEASGAASSNSSIVKLDWQTEEVLQWNAPGCEPSEAIFVEHPDRCSEDHGLLLASVVGTVDQRSLFLVILDAKSMTEVAKVDFKGVSVPSAIHGMFFSEEQLLKAAIATKTAEAKKTEAEEK